MARIKVRAEHRGNGWLILIGILGLCLGVAARVLTDEASYTAGLICAVSAGLAIGGFTGKFSKQ